MTIVEELRERRGLCFKGNSG